jgi:AraC-like DNA-binding protein
VHPIDVECAFIAFATRIRVATSGKHRPAAMDLATPDWGTGEIMAREAGCPVNHRADGNRLVFSRQLWEAPPDLANPALEQVLAPDVEDADLITRVRVAITRGMHRGTATVAAVARQLGWGERSLQRRLHAEGTSYAAELDDQRRAAALAQIHQPELSVAVIAERLGFSEPSALTRAFRRWTGMSPSEFRRRGRPSSG